MISLVYMIGDVDKLLVLMWEGEFMITYRLEEKIRNDLAVSDYEL